MKKLFVFCFIFFLTGCFGEVGKGYITKECIKNEHINDMDINTTILVKSKEGELVSLNITEKYIGNDLTSIINSKKSEQNLYSQIDGIDVLISDNEISYNIDVLGTTLFVKERFNIVDEQHKMIKFYEENGYICK